jgi:PAS domain S-box-containing protein
MTKVRKAAPGLLVGVIIVVFVVAALVSAARLIGEKELIFSSYRRGTWAVVQIETEYLKLRHNLAEFRAEPPGATLEELELQLELFWSRLPILLDNEDGGELRAIPGVVAILSRIREELPEIESRLRGLTDRDPAAIRDIQQRLEAYRLPLHDIVRRALIQDSHVYNRERLYRIYVDMLAAFCVVLVTGGLLIVLLMLELRRSRRLYAEARRAEADVKAAQARMLDAIESVDGAFILLDAEGRVVMANDRYRQYYPAAAPLVDRGRHFSEIVRAAFRGGQFRTSMGEADYVASRLARSVESGPWEEILADGRVLLVNERGTTDGGRVCVSTDITAQKEAENILRQRLLALDSSIDGIAILDAVGTFTYLNDSHARIYGFDRADELIGRSWEILYDGDEWSRFRTEILPAVEERRRWQGETAGLRRDGSRFPQELTLSALDDGGLVCIVRDVSGRKRAELERVQLREQFHQAQKLEAVGRMAGGIAHDFNNILAAMMGYASFLEEDLPPGSRERGFATQILVAGGRAKSLVQQILAFSRSRDVERRTIDIGRIVAETADLLRATLPKNIVLHVEAPGGRRLVDANATQLSQVLMNLCLNAADAIGSDQGSIRIVLDEAESGADDGFGPADAGILVSKAGRVRMRVGMAGPPSPCVRIAVEDTGSGMGRDVMERMFEPFFTTKDVGKGTGLGLAAVHGIIGAHGGTLTVESEPGVGTRFVVYLPRASGETLSPERDRQVAPPTGKGRVLIVDDEEQVRDMLAHALERLGYEVATCTGALEAVEVLDEDPGAFDLVVTDHMMPEMTGQELVARLAGTHSGLPVVLCTGFADPDTRPEMPPNVAAVLAKPVDHGLLAVTVSRVLGRHPDACRNREAALSG